MTDHREHLRKTKQGLGWNFVNQAGLQLINFGISIVLARLILPSEFGLLGMVIVFTGFASLFIDFGFGAVLIQRDKITREDINTVFCCNVVMAAGLYLLFFLAAPFIARFYHEPRLLLLTRVLAISFLIAPISSVAPALVAKDMNFKLVTKISVLSLLVSSLVAIVFAYRGYGVWSIVIQTLLNSLISSVWYRAVSRIRPVLKFNKKSFRSFISMGSNIAGDTMINYWSRNADNLLIGKFVGEQSLGLYNRAYALMLLPLNNISRVITRVMFPSFSVIKNNPEEIKRIYLKINQTIALITFPLMFGLSVTANIFVPAVYGPNWNDMIPILRVLSIVGAFQSLLALNGSVYISMGRARLSFIITLIFNILYITGFISGLLIDGLRGLVNVYFFISMIGLVPHFYIVGRLIKLSLKETLLRFAKIFLAAFLMAILVWLAIANHLAALLFEKLQWQLLAYVALGFLLYTVFCFLFKIEIFLSLANRFFRKNLIGQRS